MSANVYADGVRDGFEITLRLLLGEPQSGTEPFAGPLTPECEAWAREALGRLSREEEE